MSGFFPLNIQTFLDTAIRDIKTPITEKSLSDEEKKILLQTIKRKQQKNNDREFSLQHLLDVTPSEYRRVPQTELSQSKDYPKSTWLPEEIPYSIHQNNIKRQLQTYQNTRDRTSVSYGDYPIKSGEHAAPVGQSWASMLHQSFTDPAFRLAATLGSFKAHQTPTGFRVEDDYNFDKDKEWFYRNIGRKSLSSIVKEYYDRPGSLGEILYRKYHKDRTRPVSINLEE